MALRTPGSPKRINIVTFGGFLVCLMDVENLPYHFHSVTSSLLALGCHHTNTVSSDEKTLWMVEYLALKRMAGDFTS